MLAFRSEDGLLLGKSSQGPYLHLAGVDWDDLFNARTSTTELVERWEAQDGRALEALPNDGNLLPPIQSQEVWAAGVTYMRSRTARMEESAKAGGSDFYDLVYAADRPELFFKATPHRVVGHRGALSLRDDSSWMVPEPELTLALLPNGDLLGFTIGNDLSSRDIEGENPLYLPQAKVFDHCAALGPGVWLAETFPAPETTIELTISRNGEVVFTGNTEIAQMKQTFSNLRDYLFRNNTFPNGCYLMTGTGVVPPDDFKLAANDEIGITIEPVGTLVNIIK